MYMYGEVLSVSYNIILAFLLLHVRGFSSVFVEVGAYRFALVQMAVRQRFVKDLLLIIKDLSACKIVLLGN